MPRKKRLVAPNTFYHVFNRGVAKMPIVTDDMDRKAFFKCLGESIRENDADILAYCLMDNHFHLLLRTKTANLPKLMWKHLSQYVRRYNHRHNRVGPLFQSRYKDKIISSDAYALQALRYIHLNPVKDGLTERCEDYPWSSYACYLGLLPRWPWLNTEFFLKLFHSDPQTAQDTFARFHDSGITEDYQF